MSKQKIVFIVNPNSGTDRKKQSFLTHLQDFRKQSPFEVILEYTARAHHAKEIVNEYLAGGAKRFVAVGGDGTVNEVASQLIHKEATLYIIPKGSGNGLARHLGIPLDEPGAFQTILKDRKQTIDCGVIHGIPFLCTAGIGFDAYSAALFSGSKRRGFLTYVKTGFAAYKNYEPVALSFQNMDTRAFSLTFANANQFGNNAFIAPKALIDDGFLDCTFIKPHAIWQSVGLIFRLFGRSVHESDLAETYRAKHFQIETQVPPLIHFDGEPYQLDVTTLEISILEKAIRIGI